MIKPTNVGKNYLFLIIAIFPALLAITDLYNYAQMEITLLEWKSHTDSLGFDPKTLNLIYNVGNEPLTNIVVTYNTQTKDELISFHSLDGNFIKQEYLNDNLVMYIERISPNSHVEITTKGNIIPNIDRTVSVTSDETSSQTISLPEFIHGGITTINFHP